MTEYQFITYSADNMIEDIRAFDSAQKLYKYVRKFPLVGNAVRAELWVMEGRDLQKKFTLDWDVPRRCRIPRWCVGKVDLLKFLESMDSEPKSTPDPEPEPEKVTVHNSGYNYWEGIYGICPDCGAECGFVWEELEGGNYITVPHDYMGNKSYREDTPVEYWCKKCGRGVDPEPKPEPKRHFNVCRFIDKEYYVVCGSDDNGSHMISPIGRPELRNLTQEEAELLAGKLNREEWNKKVKKMFPAPEPTPIHNPHPDKQDQCSESGCSCFVAPISQKVKSRWLAASLEPRTYCRRHGGSGRAFGELKRAERELRQKERAAQKSAAALNPNPRKLFDASGRVKKNQGMDRVKNQDRESWIRRMEERGWNMKDRVILKDWTLTMHPADAHNRYLAPECRRTCLGGKAQNHPDPSLNSTTENLTTSAIRRIDGRLVETVSGTVYELSGHPCDFFNQEVLTKHKAKYNYREPLYFLSN